MLPATPSNTICVFLHLKEFFTSDLHPLPRSPRPSPSLEVLSRSPRPSPSQEVLSRFKDSPGPRSEVYLGGLVVVSKLMCATAGSFTRGEMMAHKALEEIARAHGKV